MSDTLSLFDEPAPPVMLAADALAPAVLDVLASATVEADRVRLTCPQLPRPVYEAVDEVLRRLGGAWKGGKTRAHLFPYDPRPLVAAVVASERMPAKNPHAYFPTPPELVALMLEEVGLGGSLSPWRVLEPSAGTGAIADAILAAAPNVALDVVELVPLNVGVLRAKGHRVYEGDFLAYAADPYDVVVMNPPFSVEGDRLAWATHLAHAWSLLNDRGRLVAITPTFAHRTDRRTLATRDLIAEHGEWEEVPAGTFAASGTMVATCLVTMDRERPRWRRQPYQGWHCWHCWSVNLACECDRAWYDAAVAQGAAASDAWIIEHYDTTARRLGVQAVLTDPCRRALVREFRESRMDDALGQTLRAAA